VDRCARLQFSCAVWWQSRGEGIDCADDLKPIYAGKVLDRKTIMQILLTDQRDPFRCENADAHGHAYPLVL
jgi:hypothetical protein